MVEVATLREDHQVIIDLTQGVVDQDQVTLLAADQEVGQVALLWVEVADLEVVDLEVLVAHVEETNTSS